MDRLIYVAMTGARESMRAQSVVSHNIANAGTIGFRALQHSLRGLRTFAITSSTPARA